MSIATASNQAPASAEPTLGRVLTGDRPTGALHLGHYFGTIANRVALQQRGHDLQIVIADYQVITDRDRPGDLPQLVTGLVLDYLACGLDQEQTTIFVHSAVPALNQLMLPFLSLISVAELSRNPTTKDEVRLSGHRSVSGLMLTYPVHQAADVLFCKANLVPVGKDQLPHLELTRTIARRFNDRYDRVFPLPEGMLSDTPVLPGFDGRKMAKSLGNGIALTDPDDVIVAKIRAARTDGERQITFETERRPEVASLLRIAARCAGQEPEELAADIGDGGGAALKRSVTEAVIEFLKPIRARRRQFTAADARSILARGITRATQEADATLAEVNSAMRMTYRR
jgi:tryptophanyl-tRNA synthetase